MAVASIIISSGALRKCLQNSQHVQAAEPLGYVPKEIQLFIKVVLKGSLYLSLRMYYIDTWTLYVESMAENIMLKDACGFWHAALLPAV